MSISIRLAEEIFSKMIQIRTSNMPRNPTAIRLEFDTDIVSSLRISFSSASAEMYVSRALSMSCCDWWILDSAAKPTALRLVVTARPAGVHSTWGRKPFTGPRPPTTRSRAGYRDSMKAAPWSASGTETCCCIREILAVWSNLRFCGGEGTNAEEEGDEGEFLFFTSSVWS